MRYHHTAKLITLESLFANSIDQDSFLETYDPQLSRIPIFQQIHAEGDIELAAEKAASVAKSQDESHDVISDSGESTVGSSGDNLLEISPFYLSD